MEKREETKRGEERGTNGEGKGKKMTQREKE